MNGPPGIQLTTTREAGNMARLNILVHGPSGAGKTYLAKTTGDLEHTLVIAAEPGLLTLRDVSIRVVEVTSLDVLQRVYAWLSSGEHEFRWLVIDSLSEVAEKCLDEELKRPGTAGKKRHGLEAYGDMGRRMEALIKAFRDLPLHVVMTCKQERVPDESGALLYGPSLPGRKLSQGIAYFFDEVFALRVDRVTDDNGASTITRFLQTARDYTHDAKDRSGALAEREPPDLAHIAEKILGSTTQIETQATEEAA